MTQDELTQAVAEAALDYVVEGKIVGVGTGSTARLFIEALAGMKDRIAGAVASSEDTKRRLEGHGIKVFDLNDVTDIPVYIDGADEITPEMHMIKGGGGALTREKIVSAVAQKFVCIADGSKLVDVLGTFPLPVEVIPMASAYVARELTKLYENFETIALSEADAWLKTASEPRGEYVLVLHEAATQSAETHPAWHNTLAVLLKELPLKQAVALTVTLTQAAKNEVYAHALALKNQS